ncbi:MAG: hypothetical protein LBQ51_09680 [Desulfovibrio sp.]|jgi:hypothetical protein|nr:hypothetical protein [Desulfovibrio sp.]
MTRDEARKILAENWWKGISGQKPVDRHFFVGEFAGEDDDQIGFYAGAYADDDTPPEAGDSDLDVWWVPKGGGICSPRIW